MLSCLWSDTAVVKVGKVYAQSGLVNFRERLGWLWLKENLAVDRKREADNDLPRHSLLFC